MGLTQRSDSPQPSMLAGLLLGVSLFFAFAFDGPVSAMPTPVVASAPPVFMPHGGLSSVLVWNGTATVAVGVGRIVLDASLQPTDVERPWEIDRTPRATWRTEYNGFTDSLALHGLVRAVHRAFAEHLTLRLSPDDIWTVITQGVGQHINMGDNAERLRHKFVAHEGKKEIVVRRDYFVRGATTRDDWMTVVPEWSERVCEYDNGNSGLMQHMVQRFTTTTPLHTFGYQAALLSAMQAYFDFILITACGIPTVELVGAVADWQQLVDATKALDLVGLDEQLRPWNDRLVPIVESLARARANAEEKCTTAEDIEFLKGIYKYEHWGSGGSFISGWITALFPYLGRLKGDDLASLTRHLHKNVDEEGREVMPFVTSDDFPSGLTTVPFLWKYYSLSFPMAIHAGFDAPHVSADHVISCTHSFAVEYTKDPDVIIAELMGTHPEPEPEVTSAAGVV